MLLFFGLVIIFLQRAQELPCLDDLTGVSVPSQIAAACGLVFSALTLLPYPVSAPLEGGIPPPF